MRNGTIEFRLPAPPSTNNLYRNVSRKGRVKTAAYKAWCEYAGWDVKAQWNGVPIPGKFGCAIYLPPGIDLDNCKAILDLLGPSTKHGLGVTADDRHCQQLCQYRSGVADGKCIVSVWPIGGD